MSEYEEAIDKHYGQEDLGRKILAALQEVGKDVDHLSRDDLASFDEHHGGGREATRELAGIVGLREGTQVLDVGSGIGGPARTLAAEFGCRVIGLELTEEYCDAATTLTTRVGLDDKVTFQQGNALDMPFGDASFDIVWTQDVLMNIEDKPRLFTEVHRVLRPGGRFAIQASMAGQVPEVIYPTFWADDLRLSFLIRSEACRNILHGAGLHEIIWRDTTAEAVAQSRSRAATGSEEAVPDQDKPVLGLGLIVETDLERRIANMLQNFAEGRLAKVVAVFERRS